MKCELYELLSHMIIFMSCLKSLEITSLKKIGFFFFLIFKDEIPKVDDLDMLKSIWFGD